MYVCSYTVLQFYDIEWLLRESVHSLTKMMLVFLCLLRFVRVNIYIEHRQNGQTFTRLNHRYVVKCMLDTYADKHREVPEAPRV